MNSMTTKNCELAKNQIGLTLLESLLSLTVLSVTSLGIYKMVEGYAQSAEQSLVAQQHVTFGKAAQAYIKDNYQAISTQLGPSIAYKISTADLAATNRLPASYRGVNAYQQNICAVVRLVAPLTPQSLPQLQALVIAEGGKAADDISLGRIASQIGGSGGAVYARDPEVIKGSHGGWSIDLSAFNNLPNSSGTDCSGASGNVVIKPGRHVSALWFENGDVSTSFLSRDEVPGLRTLNTMNTPLILGAGAQAVNGASCQTTQKGAVARDSLGRILSCQAPTFKWKQVSNIHWEDPVEQSSWLSGLNSVMGQVRLDNETGQANYFNGAAGSGWANLFVSPSGNLSIGTQGVNATGDDNAYFGIGSAPKNVTGAGSLHLGNNTGRQSAAGWGNTYAGNNVSPLSTGSTTNSFFGYNVASKNKKTTGNTFAGAYSGVMNEEGNYNTFYGTSSGAKTLSSNNNFFGFSAGYHNVLGIGNAYFGDWSGRSNAEGNNNTFLGQYSGSDSNVSNAIAIGNGAIVASSNAIQLGRNSIAYQIRLGGPGSTVQASSFSGDAVAALAFTGGTFSGSAFTNTSDARLKTDIQDSQRGLAFIKQLRPVEYGLITDAGRKHQGFLAQEVEALDPDFTAVQKPPGDGQGHYALNYIEFIPSIVKAIQQLDAKSSSVQTNADGVNALGYLQAALIGFLLLLSLSLLNWCLRMNRTMKSMQLRIMNLELNAAMTGANQGSKA